MYRFIKVIIPLIAIILLIVVSLACGGTTSISTSQPTQLEQALSPEVTQPTNTIAPTVKREPTATLISTATEVPTHVPTPNYSEPVVLLEISGTGAAITDDFQLPACFKSVLYWDVAANSFGAASLILTGYNKGTGDSLNYVNEFAMNIYIGGINGSAYSSLSGGTYYFQIENTDEVWNVRVECQDGVAPVGTGMNIQGVGSVVTDNYTLTACNKSIFNWSVEPNSSGVASLILTLCSLEECSTIVNEFKQDMTSALTGQALQGLKGGDYFLYSENTQQPWSVTWECKD